MHFHQKIHNYLLKYKNDYNSNFKFIVRQRTSIKDKKYPGGKFAHGLVFQGTEKYCFVGLVDKSGGANATKSIGVVINPTKNNSFKAKLEIVFPGETDLTLIAFYKNLASKFKNISWDAKEERADLYIGEFPENDPTILYKWLDVNFPIIRETALQTGIEKLIPSDVRFKKLQDNLEKRVLSDKKPSNYWVFQGNPEIYDITKALKAGHLKSWKVAAHKDKIKIGDQVILWQTGSLSGCYAFAEVTSDVNIFEEETNEQQYYTETLNTNATERVQIKIIKNLVEDPILWKDIKEHPTFLNFKAGNQGTNFSATEAEFNALLHLYESKLSTMDSKNISIKKIVNPLNQILYGPPGTGKTYNTVNSALQIVDLDFYEENKLNRAQLKERFDTYLLEGSIMFTTFHQSMGYEDFIEGIKPISVENEVKYEVEDGIFKEACIRAKGIRNNTKPKANIDFSSKSFFKMSLGGKHKKNVHNWCIENNIIALGWGRNNDFSELKGINQFEEFKDVFNTKYPELVQESRYNIQAVYCFLNWMKKGDIVLVSLGNKIIDAIGVIEGDYEFVKDSKHSYHHTRSVRWLGTNLDSSPKLFVEKNISQQTIYNFNPEDIIIDRFEKEFNTLEVSKSENENHVLIIDEINRGNVSSIFGELITLLETDKRKGNKEELEVILPYSKELFSIPNNLHIIGTMNTADRSVEALDTALRRRFEFKEMMPDYTVIKDERVGELKLSKVLETINQRIELLIDRDHTIGHSYFVGVNTEAKLASAFKNKIVPLLQEYFYGDYGKIGLVLGDGFVKSHSKSNNPFASFNYEGKEELNRDFFDLIAINDKFDMKKAIETLLNNAKDN